MRRIQCVAVLTSVSLICQVCRTLSNPNRVCVSDLGAPGNMWGCTFVCGYSELQVFEKAVSGYLGALFHYFCLPMDSAAYMTLHYYKNPSRDTEDDLAAWMNTANGSVCDHIILDSEPTSIETVEFPHKTIPCTLIASNNSPGFGSSCTQEELVTGACPPLLLLGALFISPPVPFSLLAYGHSTITRWQGQGREAHSLEMFSSRNHTFLLLDASELDIISDLSTKIADLHPLYLIRDLNKAYTVIQLLKRSFWQLPELELELQSILPLTRSVIIDFTTIK